MQDISGALQLVASQHAIDNSLHPALQVRPTPPQHINSLTPPQEITPLICPEQLRLKAKNFTPYPERIVSAIKATGANSHVFSGYLKEIDRVFVVVKDELFIWNSSNPHNAPVLSYTSPFSQGPESDIITHVVVAPAFPGCFEAEVTDVLIIVYQSHVGILTIQPNPLSPIDIAQQGLLSSMVPLTHTNTTAMAGATAYHSIYLGQTGLFCPLDEHKITTIVPTSSGRVLCGLSNSHVTEIIYAPILLSKSTPFLQYLVGKSVSDMTNTVFNTVFGDIASSINSKLTKTSNLAGKSAPSSRFDDDNDDTAPKHRRKLNSDPSGADGFKIVPSTIQFRQLTPSQSTLSLLIPIWDTPSPVLDIAVDESRSDILVMVLYQSQDISIFSFGKSPLASRPTGERSTDLVQYYTAAALFESNHSDSLVLMATLTPKQLQTQIKLFVKKIVSYNQNNDISSATNPSQNAQQGLSFMDSMANSNKKFDLVSLKAIPSNVTRRYQCMVTTLEGHRVYLSLFSPSPGPTQSSASTEVSQTVLAVSEVRFAMVDRNQANPIGPLLQPRHSYLNPNFSSLFSLPNSAIHAICEDTTMARIKQDIKDTSPGQLGEMLGQKATVQGPDGVEYNPHSLPFTDLSQKLTPIALTAASEGNNNEDRVGTLIHFFEDETGLVDPDLSNVITNPFGDLVIASRDGVPSNTTSTSAVSSAAPSGNTQGPAGSKRNGNREFVEYFFIPSRVIDISPIPLFSPYSSFLSTEVLSSPTPPTQHQQKIMTTFTSMFFGLEQQVNIWPRGTNSLTSSQSNTNNVTQRGQTGGSITPSTLINLTENFLQHLAPAPTYTILTSTGVVFLQATRQIDIFLAALQDAVTTQSNAPLVSFIHKYSKQTFLSFLLLFLSNLLPLTTPLLTPNTSNITFSLQFLQTLFLSDYGIDHYTGIVRNVNYVELNLQHQLHLSQQQRQLHERQFSHLQPLPLIQKPLPVPSSYTNPYPPSLAVRVQSTHPRLCAIATLLARIITPLWSTPMIFFTHKRQLTATSSQLFGLSSTGASVAEIAVPLSLVENAIGFYQPASSLAKKSVDYSPDSTFQSNISSWIPTALSACASIISFGSTDRAAKGTNVHSNDTMRNNQSQGNKKKLSKEEQLLNAQLVPRATLLLQQLQSIREPLLMLYNFLALNADEIVTANSLQQSHVQGNNIPILGAVISDAGLVSHQQHMPQPQPRRYNQVPVQQMGPRYQAQNQGPGVTGAGNVADSIGPNSFVEGDDITTRSLVQAAVQGGQGVNNPTNYAYGDLVARGEFTPFFINDQGNSLVSDQSHAMQIERSVAIVPVGLQLARPDLGDISYLNTQQKKYNMALFGSIMAMLKKIIGVLNLFLSLLKLVSFISPQATFGDVPVSLGSLAATQKRKLGGVEQGQNSSNKASFGTLNSNTFGPSLPEQSVNSLDTIYNIGYELVFSLFSKKLLFSLATTSFCDLVTTPIGHDVTRAMANTISLGNLAFSSQPRLTFSLKTCFGTSLGHKILNGWDKIGQYNSSTESSTLTTKPNGENNKFGDKNSVVNLSSTFSVDDIAKCIFSSLSPIISNGVGYKSSIISSDDDEDLIDLESFLVTQASASFLPSDFLLSQLYTLLSSLKLQRDQSSSNSPNPVGINPIDAVNNSQPRIIFSLYQTILTVMDETLNLPPLSNNSTSQKAQQSITSSKSHLLAAIANTLSISLTHSLSQTQNLAFCGKIDHHTANSIQLMLLLLSFDPELKITPLLPLLLQCGLSYIAIDFILIRFVIVYRHGVYPYLQQNSLSKPQSSSIISETQSTPFTSVSTQPGLLSSAQNSMGSDNMNQRIGPQDDGSLCGLLFQLLAETTLNSPLILYNSSWSSLHLFDVLYAFQTMVLIAIHTSPHAQKVNFTAAGNWTSSSTPLQTSPSPSSSSNQTNNTLFSPTYLSTLADQALSLGHYGSILGLLSHRYTPKDLFENGYKLPQDTFTALISSIYRIDSLLPQYEHSRRTNNGLVYHQGGDWVEMQYRTGRTQPLLENTIEQFEHNFKLEKDSRAKSSASHRDETSNLTAQQRGDAVVNALVTKTVLHIILQLALSSNNVALFFSKKDHLASNHLLDLLYVTNNDALLLDFVMWHTIDHVEVRDQQTGIVEIVQKFTNNILYTKIAIDLLISFALTPPHSPQKGSGDIKAYPNTHTSLLELFPMGQSDGFLSDFSASKSPSTPNDSSKGVKSTPTTSQSVFSPLNAGRAHVNSPLLMQLQQEMVSVALLRRDLISFSFGHFSSFAVDNFALDIDQRKLCLSLAKQLLESNFGPSMTSVKGSRQNGNFEGQIPPKVLLSIELAIEQGQMMLLFQERVKNFINTRFQLLSSFNHFVKNYDIAQTEQYKDTILGYIDDIQLYINPDYHFPLIDRLSSTIFSTDQMMVILFNIGLYDLCFELLLQSTSLHDKITNIQISLPSPVNLTQQQYHTLGPASSIRVINNQHIIMHGAPLVIERDSSILPKTFLINSSHSITTPAALSFFLTSTRSFAYIQNTNALLLSNESRKVSLSDQIARGVLDDGNNIFWSYPLAHDVNVPTLPGQSLPVLGGSNPWVPLSAHKSSPLVTILWKNYLPSLLIRSIQNSYFQDYINLNNPSEKVTYSLDHNSNQTLSDPSLKRQPLPTKATQPRVNWESYFSTELTSLLGDLSYDALLCPLSTLVPQLEKIRLSNGSFVSTPSNWVIAQVLPSVTMSSQHLRSLATCLVLYDKYLHDISNTFVPLSTSTDANSQSNSGFNTTFNLNHTAMTTSNNNHHRQHHRNQQNQISIPLQPQSYLIFASMIAILQEATALIQPNVGNLALGNALQQQVIYSLPTIERRRLLGLCNNSISTISPDSLNFKLAELDALVTSSQNSLSLLSDQLRVNGGDNVLTKKIDKANKKVQLATFQLMVIKEFIHWRNVFRGVDLNTPMANIIQ